MLQFLAASEVVSRTGPSRAFTFAIDAERHSFIAGSGAKYTVFASQANEYTIGKYMHPDKVTFDMDVRSSGAVSTDLKLVVHRYTGATEEFRAMSPKKRRCTNGF